MAKRIGSGHSSTGVDLRTKQPKYHTESAVQRAKAGILERRRADSSLHPRGEPVFLAGGRDRVGVGAVDLGNNVVLLDSGAVRSMKVFEEWMSETSLASTENGFTPELGLHMAYIFATDTRTLTQLCIDEEIFPPQTTVYVWADRHKKFGEQWANAKKLRSHLLWDKAVQVLEDVEVDHQFGSSRVAKAKALSSIYSRMGTMMNRADYDNSYAGQGLKEIGNTFADLVRSAKDRQRRQEIEEQRGQQRTLADRVRPNEDIIDV